MFVVRTMVRLLAGFAIAAAIIAATTMWRILQDPVSLTTAPVGSLLLPAAAALAHAIGLLVRRF
jgi:hypothetical protein